MKPLSCLILMLPMLLILPGCSTFNGGRPDWLANPKSVYPKNQFLSAVGEGDTRRAAENAAAANLARIFEAHIQSDERILDQSKETNSAFERSTDFTSDINILSSQTLFNVKHAEAWQDAKGRVHAVAYLNRSETAALYLSTIEEQTARVRFLAAQTGQNVSLLKRYAALRAAVRQAEENSGLLRQLKVIAPRAIASATPDYSENDLRKALADTAKQIHVQIRIENDADRRITNCLEELITRYGFVVGKPADLEINGRVAIADTGQRTAELVFVRYELAASINDNAGNTLAAINEKGREGHVNLNEARTRSFRTLENAIKSGGAKRLDAYFDSLIDQP